MKKTLLILLACAAVTLTACTSRSDQTDKGGANGPASSDSAPEVTLAEDDLQDQGTSDESEADPEETVETEEDGETEENEENEETEKVTDENPVTTTPGGGILLPPIKF